MALKKGTREAGCGCTKGILRYLPIPYADTFHTACYEHDNQYDNARVKRKVADRELFYNMLTIVKRNVMQKGVAYCAWLVVIACLYYASVRVFGGLYYNKAKKN